MKDVRVNVGGTELQVRDYERGGPAVLFLHFGGGNMMIWHQTVPFFLDDYRPVLVDLRGHGKSDKPATGNHIDEMARDLVGVLEHLNIERCHVIGSSLGAEVGLSLAVNHPEKVLSLVCDGALYSEYGPYGIREGSEAEFKEYVAHRLETIRNRPVAIYPSVDALVEADRKGFEKYNWNETCELATRYDAFQIAEDQYTYCWQKPSILDYMSYYFEYRFEDYYRRIKCPVLMLPGEEELKNERKKLALQGLSQCAPQSKIAYVPGWIYANSWLVDPTEGIKAILSFLAEVRQGESAA